MDDLNQIDVVHMNWDNYQPGDHQTIKKIIKGNINSVCANYVAIGYYLDNIAERKLYQEDGYSGIGEYAEAEYGIKKDKCSYLIKIAKKFCIPNSPALLPEYREFKVEKLREMVYLTDDQLEQVTLTTTRAEIRDMRKSDLEPEKVAPAQLEPDYYNKLAAYWCKRQMTVELYELAKSQNDEDIDVFNQYFNEKFMRSECYAPAYNTSGYEISFKTNKNGIYFDDEEKTVYSWQLLIDLVCQEAENDTPASKPINFHENDNGLKRLREIRREIKAKSKESKLEKAVPDNEKLVNKTVGTVIKEPESVTDIPERACFNCKYNIMPREDYFKEYPDTDEFPCDNCNGDLNNWRPDTGIVNQEVDSAVEQEPENSPSEFPCDTCEHEKSTGCCDYDSEDGYCVLGDKWKPKNLEEPEIVEADVIHTETDNSNPERYSLTDINAEVRFLTANLATMRKENMMSPARYKTKMRLDAATALQDKLREPVAEEIPEVIQPDLPILKNNDQRKDFIDNYTSWPIWIDQELTGERYYRYDLTDKVAIVVKVRRKHAYAGYKETKDFEYGAEQYYLLGIKSEWSQKGTKIVVDETRTFYECNTNKSALVDYLKDFQKKG